MKLKKVLSLTLVSVMMLFSLTACGKSNEEGKNNADTPVATTETADAEVVLQVGFENNMTEPFSQGVQKWADLLAEQSNGTMKIDLYPDSQLGGKPALIDSMLLGENVCTLADGAFYADYGVPDFGIVFGPFLFDTWDECWTLIESDWYKEQTKLLEDKGLKLIASNWKYGERHTLTVDPVNTVDDLKGMKIRVPSNQIQSLGFDTMGAASVGMDLGDVYQALQTKTIDGAENPLATLYGRKLHEVAKNLILDGHVKNFTTLVCSEDWFNGLTEEQQELLVSTAKEAGLYNNEIQEIADKDYLDKMKEEGVTVVEPSEEVIAAFKEKVKPFYEMEDTFGWTPGLYDTVKAAMTK
ncbi:tripartite ATP-independent transporter solute receptor, DctP family [Anaerosphaera aminiphila DSM 21120]|uniref:Tripartite ATP-independent transporter solute receptor, DctP family n=1 Tax=Anaerosphaera aminiphila DSM 21120 TaxID=1120995 RepID=A0A1M5U635_9FIRM|nr:C4-dicarboxylate TRAP transporter substrate-binding protein [Anaerosphaera aminiphila]SHH58398.1 tripartite ATP-independent transporter solute receptor, DctP family [Anaerosphaera aminiphila DSM 21120]